ncbi:MAG: hypothetical protein KY457_02360 [Actinobacteria bacterium]|nr:hypothetical protein [Actinomycetota bacterium]
MIATLDRRLVGRVLVAVGLLGAVTSVLGAAVGFRFLHELDGALDDSLGVTADAVDALRTTVELGADTVDAVTRTVGETETTTRELSVALRDAEQALAGVASLSDDGIAGSLDAVEGSLPALIDVASAIDTTLSRLAALPFGPAYDPDERFDDSLRAIEREFDGLPEQLRAQADLIRDAGDGLGRVRRGTTRVADDLRALHATLASASTLVDRYAATAEEAADVVAQGHQDLRTNLLVGRALVLVLGLSLLLGQLVPLGAGWFLLRPEAAAAFLARREAAS